MNRIVTISLAFLFTCLSSIHAERFSGINISYNYVGSLKYEVTYKVYADKYVKGKPDIAPLKPLNFRIIAGPAIVVNSPILIKTDSLKRGCDTNLSIIYIYYYQETIDLNLPKYSAIKASVDCRIYFTCYYPERYTGIKNIQNASYYTYAFVNTCHNSSNTSVKITNDPVLNNCCNQPYYLSSGAIDTTDSDSIGYEFSNPLKDHKQPVMYNSGYSIKEPLDVYWPPTYDKSYGPLPFSNPPIGLYLEPNSGALIYTPNSCSSVYSICTKLTEYRKINNKYEEVGGSLNDQILYVSACPGNNPPYLNGPYNYETTGLNQICFTITSDDKQFIPPPPSKALPPDTVKITWNRGIPGATFTIVDPKARLMAGKFCWTPKLSDIRDAPHKFTVTAKDNSCSVNGYTTKTYTVKVKNPLNSISQINRSIFIISPNPSMNGDLNISSVNSKFNRIILFDISGKQLMAWNFEPTSNFQQNLEYLAPGIYVIKCVNGGEVVNFKWVKE